MLEGEDSLYNDPHNGWVRKRRKEFMNVLDKNHDGIASKDELEVFDWLLVAISNDLWFF